MEKVTFKGQSTKIKGSLPEVGEKAPPFELVNQQLEEIALGSLGSKRKILNVFISLDTSVCSKSIHTFYEKVGQKENVILLNISLDLPFAAARFCQQEKLNEVVTLSAFRSSFPDDYGVRILDGKLKGLCARAVFILDEQNKVLHRELVSEMTDEPDYEKALSVL